MTENKQNEIKADLDLTEAKIELEHKKRELTSVKITNAFENALQIVFSVAKILGVIAFVLLLIAAVGFGVWWVCLFSGGAADAAGNVMMVLQLLTGVISVAVGIWALILTIRSRNEAKALSDRLNIKTQKSNNNVQAMSHEPDINPASLG